MGLSHKGNLDSFRTSFPSKQSAWFLELMSLTTSWRDEGNHRVQPSFCQWAQRLRAFSILLGLEFKSLFTPSPAMSLMLRLLMVAETSLTISMLG